jgi:hypothetical protein
MAAVRSVTPLFGAEALRISAVFTGEAAGFFVEATADFAGFLAGMLT